MLVWHSHGRAFPPEVDGPLPAWTGGYGSLPYAVPSRNGGCRVLFSGRDAQNRAQIGACTLDLDALAVVPNSITPTPLISTGPPGSFDESGVSMSCVVADAGRWYLYYTGWTLGRTVPFYLAIGLAISRDEGCSFEKVSLAPVLGRHRVDPFLCASPSVLIEEGLWRMWYISAVRWEPRPEGMRHYYLVKYAESRDGLEWKRDGRICLGFSSEEEYAIGRPNVLKLGNLYRMWYCVRGSSYRIGYAESPDGLVWTRRDDLAGLRPSPSGWDSEMQAYPMVFQDGERLVMLYNGNGYGATGFGCATEEPSPST